MEKKIGEFMVQAEDGQRYLIFEFQTFIPADTLEDPSATIPGLPIFRTPEGFNVNHVEDDLYKIVHLGITARRDPVL